MAATTSIEWTERTWNPVVGCEIVSPGCAHCYAMRMAARIEAMGTAPHYKGLTRKVNGHAVWTGVMRPAPDRVLMEPLHWKKPSLIFVNSMSDLFAEGVSDETIDQVFAVMGLAHWHTFQVLTKRPERMRAYFAETWQPAPAHDISLGRSEALHVPAEVRGDDRWDHINLACDDLDLLKIDRVWTADGELIGRPAWPRRPLPNVWLGISAEDQPRYDERWPHLRDTPAAVRFLSAEPLLGRIEILPGLDWVIVGGESGAGARPMHPDWARALRDDCATLGVPFFFKQWGEWREAFHNEDGPKVEEVEVGSETAESLASLAKNPCWLTGAGRAFRYASAIGDEPARMMERLGKKGAGRLLDGRAHDAMPSRP